MSDHWKKELENKEGLDEGVKAEFIYLCLLNVPCHLLIIRVAAVGLPITVLGV
jgi:hypothetical protein